MLNKTYRSNGKLLLTGEYLVLDGALSLAVPTYYGQSLTVKEINEPKINWKSIDNLGNVWFEQEFLIEDIVPLPSKSHNTVFNRLLQIINAAKKLNPTFLSQSGFNVITRLDFNKDWGLGTSSTLINNIAHWANIDAYKLLELTFGGSGYDIACAQYNCPITYKLKKSYNYAQRDGILNNVVREIKPIDFNPVFTDHLYFVYLNIKQNSGKSIAQYKLMGSNSKKPISEINDITSQIISCKSLDVFNDLLIAHENIIARLIKHKTVKELLFNDFDGSIKSLGAWGGDFVLVSSKENPETYFSSKGFKIIVPYKDMVLNNMSPT